jgi:hypothetical protein
VSGYGDSYCGIWCGACSVLVHGEAGRADAFIACCAGIPKADLACRGCKSDSVYAGCRTCAIRDCAIGKGVDHCSACSEYPCRSYVRWQSAARLLPHIREAAASLNTIRQGSVESWLSAQKTRWSCPSCGTRFSWYAPSCAACGRSLDQEAFTITGLRKLVCRWMFPKLYRKGKAGPNRKTEPSTG